MKNTEIIKLEDLENKVSQVEEIRARKGFVDFPQKQEILVKANEVASYISELDVTEDNLKECKKTLAEAKKIVNALHSKRIEVKKYLLEPYDDFMNDIKEIAAPIDAADELVRAKVRELEELERDQKKDELENIWNKRKEMFTCNEYVKFDDWLTPAMLNKTVSIKKAEDDMVDWLTKTSQDIEVIIAGDNMNEVLNEYLQSFNLALAISNVNTRKQQERIIKEKLSNDDSNAMVEKLWNIVITGEKDIELAKRILDEHNINYKEV